MGENSGEKTRTVARTLGRADIDGNGNFEEVKFDNDEEILVMKRMISSHPLFELLIQTHINCLKVGLGEIEEDAKATSLEEANNNSSTLPSTSLELDKFMEAYCMALKKLKEAMEEPLKDAKSFITNMYAQLDEDLSVSKLNSEVLADNFDQTLVLSD